MKGIVLAGGTGSRLFPLTKVTNKHLLPVGKKPMIYYPIEKMLQAGIKDILIVTGLEHMGEIVNLLGSGKDFDCRFTYRVQDEAGGIAQALSLAEDFVGDDHCVVILGDNIIEDDITPFVESFLAQDRGAKILLKEVQDPERFGVAEIEGDRIIGIEEKPKNPKSSHAVTGIYMYDCRVFEYIKNLKPSARGEYEITDANNLYIQAGEMAFDDLKGYWTDAGTFESLYKASDLVK
ncbi:sugar phosphate nucleotidyltransferase [Candidatus Margulisiibacteriota bacterium]